MKSPCCQVKAVHYPSAYSTSKVYYVCTKCGNMFPKEKLKRT